MTAIRYVTDHPERFMPLQGDPDDIEFARYAESRNGRGADPRFIRKVLEGYKRLRPVQDLGELRRYSSSKDSSNSFEWKHMPQSRTRPVIWRK